MSTPTHIILNPENWKSPKGYANGILAEERMLFLGGQIGWNSNQVFETDDFTGQVRQALENIITILAEAGGKPEHLVRLTWFVKDKGEYLQNLKAVGKAYQETIGKHFPAMSLLVVQDLLEDKAKVEIEATAILPYK